MFLVLTLMLHTGHCTSPDAADKFFCEAQTSQVVCQTYSRCQWVEKIQTTGAEAE
jgi:hypothetical protein